MPNPYDSHELKPEDAAAWEDEAMRVYIPWLNRPHRRPVSLAKQQTVMLSARILGLTAELRRVTLRATVAENQAAQFSDAITALAARRG